MKSGGALQRRRGRVEVDMSLFALLGTGCRVAIAATSALYAAGHRFGTVLAVDRAVGMASVRVDTLEALQVLPLEVLDPDASVASQISAALGLRAGQGIYFCRDGVWIADGPDGDGVAPVGVEPYQFTGSAADLVAILVQHPELNLGRVQFRVWG